MSARDEPLDAQPAPGHGRSRTRSGRRAVQGHLDRRQIVPGVIPLGQTLLDETCVSRTEASSLDPAQRTRRSTSPATTGALGNVHMFLATASGGADDDGPARRPAAHAGSLSPAGTVVCNIMKLNETIRELTATSSLASGRTGSASGTPSATEPSAGRWTDTT